MSTFFMSIAVVLPVGGIFTVTTFEGLYRIILMLSFMILEVIRSIRP